MDLRTLIRPGTSITVSKSSKEIDTVVGDRRVNAKMIDYLVTEVYPHIVICRDKNRNKESFNIGDLVMSGVIDGGATE